MAEHVATSAEFRSISKINGVFLGILYVIFGLITLICGQGMLNIIVAITGALILIMGILAYLDTKVIQAGAIQILIGAIFIVLALWGFAADIIRIIFGLQILLAGVFAILGNVPSFAGGLTIDTKSKTLNTVVGVVLVVLGIVAMINLGNSFDILIRVIGAIILVMGILEVAKAAKIIKN